MIGSVSRAVRRWTSPVRFLVAVGLWCISQAVILHLHNNFRHLAAAPVLDLRPEGYEEADVKQLLHEAGDQGRHVYLLITLLDTGVYMWSYAFIFSCLLTWAGAVAPVELLRHLVLLPWAAVAVDAVENLLTISALTTYPDMVDAIAPVLPHVSRLKWNLLYACACCIAGSGCYCLAVAAGLAGKRTRGGGGGSSSSSAANGTTQQQGRQQQQTPQRSRSKRA